MPLVPIKGSILCPVRAYKKMCKLIASSDESPLFVLSNNKIVSYNMFQRKLRCGGSFCFMSWCLGFFVLLAPYVCFHIFS